MPRRPAQVPADDLYACLGIRSDADGPAIDRAWRALLKRHHPDVAGSTSLELAKRINVAHDWLSQPTLRARYDAARRRRARHAPGAGVAPPRSPAARSAAARRAPEPRRQRSRRPESDELDLAFGLSADAVREFLARAAGLAADDVDRLSVSRPVAIPAPIRAFVPAELWQRVESLDERLRAACPPSAWSDPTARASAQSFGRAVVLELFLWYHLDHAETLVEQLRRGWESSVGQPRYGPNSPAVAAAIERFGVLTAADARRLASGWSAISDVAPWPAQADADDYAAVEVSAALARRDAAAVSPPSGLQRAERGAVTAAFARTAHVLTLRPIFAPAEYARFGAPWAAVVAGAGPVVAGPVVRRF